jgi:hypothetical protein
VKKLLVLLVLAAGLNPAAFSLSESWTGLGFGWGNLFESSSANGNTAKTYIGSPGINYDAYGFWNKNYIGLFSSTAFLFPNKGTININGVEAAADLDIYDTLFQFDFAIGPGFRVNLRDNFKLKFGIGFHYTMMVGSYTRYVGYYNDKIGFVMWGYTLGIGGDAGVKFDITDTFFISAGSAFSFDFASHVSIFSSFGNTSGWAGDYFMLGIRPYLCIGFNSWAEEPGPFKGKTGKPK